MSDRLKKVAGVLQREIVDLIREVRDPAVQEATLVTVTHVDVSGDLGVAKVLVSIIATDPHAVLKGIGRAQRFFHARLARALHMKKVPELRFYLDETEERAGAIDKILAEVSREPKVGEATSPLDEASVGLPAKTASAQDPEGDA